VVGKDDVYIPSVNFSGNGKGDDAVLTMQSNFSECMQSTGLLDKKGKEIFEGDVIREEFNHGICNCEIIYEKAGFFISNEKEEIKDNLHWHMNGLEVIGNIYENPELLTPDQLSE